MIKITEEEKASDTVVQWTEMAIGDLLVPTSSYNERLILRTYAGWVDLLDPRHTWIDLKWDTPLVGTIVPKGKKFIMEVL